MSGSYDVVVIGGGIIGLAAAHALSERAPDLRVTVIEKEAQTGLHQTARSSMVMHSGIYYPPESIKARFCREGRPLLTAFCERHQICVQPRSKTIVATHERDLPQLEELRQWGLANGVQGLEVIGPERLKDVEPHIRGIRALHLPRVGQVNFVEVARTLERLVRARGVDVSRGSAVTRITREGGGFRVDTPQASVSGRYLINCAGLHADRIALLAGAAPTVRLIPFRIMRFLLTPERDMLVRSIVYPIPEPGFPQFGVHATRRHDGRVELGPGIALALAREGYTAGTIRPREVAGMLGYAGFWQMVAKKWRQGVVEMGRASSVDIMVRALQRILPELTPHDIVRFSEGDGVLAPAFSTEGVMHTDFIVEESPGAVHMLNAPSPAATASLALGRWLADLAVTRGAAERVPVQVSTEGI